jgi:hypothetical protein
MEPSGLDFKESLIMNGAGDLASRRPAVSVIVPVYNVEPYLPECLESVLNQTLRNLEILCIDDGSTDRSLSIMEAYARKDGRVVTRTQENGGPSSARNAGLAAARGEFIYFLDGDDRIDVNALEILYAEATGNELDLVLFDADTTFENEALKALYPQYEAYYRRSRAYEEVASGASLFGEMRRNGDYKPSPCLQFIRREYLRQIGLTFYTGILHEDNLFSFQCMLQARRAKHIPAALFHRRIRPGSIMTGKAGFMNFLGRHTCVVHMLRFLSRTTLDAAVVAEALKEIRAIFQHMAGAYLDLSGEEQAQADSLMGDPRAFAEISPAYWGELAWSFALADQGRRNQQQAVSVRSKARIEELTRQRDELKAKMVQERMEAGEQRARLAERLVERRRQRDEERGKRAEERERRRKLQAQVKALEQRLATLKAQYEQSLSWRITAPLRLLGRQVRGGAKP